MKTAQSNYKLGYKAFCLMTYALCLICACAKQDPILPGVRESVFENNDVLVLNKNLPENASLITHNSSMPCPYTQDSNNVIWNGDAKIFSGFPTDHFIAGARVPACNGNFVYAGLSTGEVVKVGVKNRNVAWVSDVYRDSNMTGGASMTDIVAPVQIVNGVIFAGSLGDAFCKLRDSDGKKLWCVNIGVDKPFIITNSAAFVVATDGNLYAIGTADGTVYWRASVKKQTAPTLTENTIIVGKENFDAITGNKL